jgi:hypothetical protein
VVTDRFYTSVKFALQLLARNVYTVGTIQTNKAGFAPEVKAETESRPKGVPRGDKNGCCQGVLEADCVAVVGPQARSPSLNGRQ